MPMYEFYCPRCDKLTEELVDLDVNSIDCECHEQAVKVLSAPLAGRVSGSKTPCTGRYR